MKFNIVKDYYDEGVKIYEKSSLDIQPGVTVLVGCNGIGKSTLITQLIYECESKNIPCLNFDQTGDEAGHSLMDRLMFQDNIEAVARTYISSEGMRIKDSIYYFGNDYIKFMRSVEKQQQHLFFFFDALDSGLSIDNILEIKNDCFQSIIDVCNEKNKEAYIIVSANEYELCRNENCLILPELKYREIKTYDAYRKIILKSRRKRDLIYNLEEFNYE